MQKKLDHIGIAVRDLEAAIKKYQEIAGREAGEKEVVEEQKVATAFFPVGDYISLCAQPIRRWLWTWRCWLRMLECKTPNPFSQALRQ